MVPEAQASTGGFKATETALRQSGAGRLHIYESSHPHKAIMFWEGEECALILGESQGS